MNIIQKIVSRVLWVQKTATVSNRFPDVVSSDPTSLSRWDYIKYFKSWQYIAITTIWDAMSAQKTVLKNKQWNERNHPYMKFMTSELINSVSHSYELFGTAYILMIRASETSAVQWLRILRPDLMQEDFDERGRLRQWFYYGENTVTNIHKEDVIVVADWNPYQEYPHITRWVSKLSAAAGTILNDEIWTIWNQQNMTDWNTRTPVITSSQSLTKDQIKIMKDSRDESHWWVWKQNWAAFLANWFQIQNLNPTPKDMDYPLQQKWDAEKILATYRVPKAVTGMWEGVNVWNVEAFNSIFAERALTPLAQKISTAFSTTLFSWIGTYEFVNIMPVEEDNIRNNYNTGLISQNEGRNSLGYKSVKWWDVFIDGAPAVTEISGSKKDIEKKSISDTIVNKFSLLLKEVEPKKRSEDRMEKKISKKTRRMKKYYKPYNAKLQTIFWIQEKDIMKQYDSQTKDIKEISIDMKKVSVSLWNKYTNAYLRLLGPVQKDLMESEWQLAMNEVKDMAFDVNTTKSKKIQKWILTNMAQEVDKVTDKKLNAVIDAGIQGWLSPDEVRVSIQWVFTELSTSRAKKIVRTETMRAATDSQILARDQSNIVKWKERYTAQDERVCEWCGPLHWKKIGLTDPYFKKWDKYKGRDWWTMKLDYSSTEWSPLHPNCRCDLIPIVED